jgi:predicted nucleic acid-binding protein
MPGKRYLLDTNALVALLQGHAGLVTLVRHAEWLGVSVINVLEFSDFDGLSEADRALTRAVKLPDAIVMASASLHDATVITNDAVLLKLGAVNSDYAAQAF